MSNVIKFPNSGHLKPFPVAVDGVLRAMGIPAAKRNEVVVLVEDADRAYRIPDIELSVGMPDGLTAEQFEQIRREIHREFARYGEQLRMAKHNYILTEVKKKLGIYS